MNIKQKISQFFQREKERFSSKTPAGKVLYVLILLIVGSLSLWVIPLTLTLGFLLVIFLLPSLIAFIIAYPVSKSKLGNKLKYGIVVSTVLFFLMAQISWGKIFLSDSKSSEESISGEQTVEVAENVEQPNNEEQEVEEATVEEEIIEEEEEVQELAQEEVAETVIEKPATEQPQYEYFPVTDVVDGDTIKVNINGSIKTIRFIGIDTPETVHPTQPVECFGQEASSKMRNLVSGKNVRLETDPTQGETDKYDRLLRYVFLEDGTHVNYLMIREGYAFEYTYNIPYQYQSEFQEAERLASAEGAGLWNASTCNGEDIPIEVESDPEVVEELTPTPTPSSNCLYSCSTPDRDCGDFATHQQAVDFWNCCGFTATNDPMKLDGTGIDDGIPCESLP